MNIGPSWRLAKRWLRDGAREIGRLFGPLQPTDADSHAMISQAADFRFHASYGRFVFRLHAPAPRTDPLSQADVHDAFEGSPDERTNRLLQHRGEVASTTLRCAGSRAGRRSPRPNR